MVNVRNITVIAVLGAAANTMLHWLALKSTRRQISRGPTLRCRLT